MKRLVLVGMILFASVFSWAQQDSKAKEILDQVSEKTSSFSTIKADFSFSMKNVEMDINEQNEGSIKIKGKKYLVDLPDVGIDVFCDGKTLWHYMKDGNQVTISNLEDAGNDLMDPSSLFTIYEKGFDSKLIAEKKVGSKVLYEIDLFPETEEYEVEKITLLIDKATMMISSAQLFGTDGNVYGIKVKKIETNVELADTEFVFDASKYPDVELIDFR